MHTIFAFKDNFNKISEYNIYAGNPHKLKTTDKLSD